ncbi:hypothetical protein ACWDRB_05445 [Nonomuraea sp. NPDC003707]
MGAVASGPDAAKPVTAVHLRTSVPSGQLQCELEAATCAVPVHESTFGSRITWNALLRAGLVDELHLVVGAKALGEGTPIFPQPVDGFTVAEVRRLDGSGNVLLRYATTG